MNLPASFMPDSLDGLGVEEVRTAAIGTARLGHRSHYDLGRALVHLDANGITKLGYRSAVDFAARDLGVHPREAYQLMRIERLSQNLPKLRAAYALGEISFANMRTVVAVATADTEDRWFEPARTRAHRVLYGMVKVHAEARAKRGEAPWPKTGLYGDLGRTEPAQKLTRPYTPELKALERQVWEKHNRNYGAETSWAEFQEAALVNYEQELDLVEQSLPPYVRDTLERDGWRCRVPGCSRRCQIETHHVVHRSQGGVDDADGCVAICVDHHRLHHAGLLLIEGRASSGFRFAHRASVDAEWTYWPGASRAPEPADPAEAAFDVDEMEELESPTPRGREVLEASPSVKRPARVYVGNHRPYGWLREARPSYGWRAGSSEHSSEHTSERDFEHVFNSREPGSRGMGQWLEVQATPIRASPRPQAGA